VTWKELLLANERLVHRAHQLEGVEQLILATDERRGRVFPKCFALFDEVGCGKTKQVVDAAQILWTQGEINTVLVVAPGSARSTWAHEDEILGEVAKHAWAATPNIIHEYHKHYNELDLSTSPALHWIVTNYEFIRRDDRLEDLMYQLRGRRTWLVLDESWAVKGFSAQMRACRTLRNKRAEWVTLLNGTPLSDGKPEDLYYPMSILDARIIGVQNKTHFRSKYCILEQTRKEDKFQRVVGYQNLDEFNQRIAPYVLTRRTRDCFDLPPMLDPITIEARLSAQTWELYTSMRDDMVAWLGTSASVSRQAIVKALRLAQITSGFLGGLEEIIGEPNDLLTPLTEPDPMPQWLRAKHPTAPGLAGVPPVAQGAATGRIYRSSKGELVHEIGREKLDAFLNWWDTFAPQPEKLLLWCRFRPELERTTEALRGVFPHVLNLKGGQTEEEREEAKALLAPGGDPRPGAVVGTQKAGGASLNFAAASIAVYLSNGPALIERTQSIGRIERPGATQPMRIVDVMATGPKGQKTIDHHLIRALRAKDDMARWTTQQWRDILKAS